jgi:hypothetical protein
MDRMTESQSCTAVSMGNWRCKNGTVTKQLSEGLAAGNFVGAKAFLRQRFEGLYGVNAGAISGVNVRAKKLRIESLYLVVFSGTIKRFSPSTPLDLKIVPRWNSAMSMTTPSSRRTAKPEIASEKFHGGTFRQFSVFLSLSSIKHTRALREI